MGHSQRSIIYASMSDEALQRSLLHYRTELQEAAKIGRDSRVESAAFILVELLVEEALRSVE